MMQLYDAQIGRVRQLTEDLSPKTYGYDERKIWPENEEFEMIFQKDVAFELGGGRAASVNITCVTEDPKLFCGEQTSAWSEEGLWKPGADQAKTDARDQILVYGPDLQEIKGDVSYARICEVLVRSEDESFQVRAKQDPEADDGTACDPSDSGRMLKLLQDIDFVKFHVYGKGFMMRTSGQSAREPVRVSKKALLNGITFERVGNTFISHYKKNPSVLAVRISFITVDAFDYGSLAAEAQRAVEIRNSLSKIQKGLPTECSVCDIREICNEVEGLRELHFGKKERAGKAPADSKKII